MSASMRPAPHFPGIHPMAKRTFNPSVTVAAIVERDGRYLLIEENVLGRRVLNQPAGHWEKGETLIQACVRETLEETAHHFRPTALVGVYLSRVARPRPPGEAPVETTYLRFAFCGDLGDFVPDRRLDHGIVRTLWMRPQEIRALAHVHRSSALMQCVDDYLAGARFPLSLLHTDPGLSA